MVNFKINPTDVPLAFRTPPRPLDLDGSPCTRPRPARPIFDTAVDRRELAFPQHARHLKAPIWALPPGSALRSVSRPISEGPAPPRRRELGLVGAVSARPRAPLRRRPWPSAPRSSLVQIPAPNQALYRPPGSPRLAALSRRWGPTRAAAAMRRSRRVRATVIAQREEVTNLPVSPRPSSSRLRSPDARQRAARRRQS